MPGELVPQTVADRFYFITSAVGGRARGASLMIEEDSAGMFIGNGPWSAPVTKKIYEEQATFVRGEASGYTTGDDVTIADFALFPVFMRCRDVVSEITEGPPNVDRWVADMAARSGVSKGMRFD